MVRLNCYMNRKIRQRMGVKWRAASPLITIQPDRLELIFFAEKSIGINGIEFIWLSFNWCCMSIDTACLVVCWSRQMTRNKSLVEAVGALATNHKSLPTLKTSYFEIGLNNRIEKRHFPLVFNCFSILKQRKVIEGSGIRYCSYSTMHKQADYRLALEYAKLGVGTRWLKSKMASEDVDCRYWAGQEPYASNGPKMQKLFSFFACQKRKEWTVLL